MTHRNTPRAFLLLDTLIGLLLLAILASLLAVTATRTARADRRLADSRAATRAAERTLVSLQTGVSLLPPDPSTTLTIEKLPDQPGPRAWVRVTATVNTRPATLYALLPTSTADQAALTYPAPEAKP